jgi:two-component system NtrC family sensor kinase
MLDDRVAELERANAELQRKLDERTAERDEAIARETATAEVLGVINASAGDLAPVFQAILEKALRICGATAGNLLSYDGEFFHVEAAVHADGRIAENQLDRPPLLARSDRHNLLHPLLEGKDFALSEDVRESNGYRQDPAFREMIDGGGYRSLLNVALRKESALLGSIGIYRQVVRPFTDKQIALLQNFAAQAVIAMENARLITETRKALERQTATAEVLGVINAHPGDLTPVFDAILEKAHALCGAEVGTLTAYDGEHFHALATFGYSEQFAAFVRRPFRPNVYMQRLIEGERVLHLPDQRTLESEPPDAGTTRAFLELTDLRTTLFVALRTDTSLLGYISAHRHGVHPFSEKEIALLENFATQAVIAMENARLLGELRQRTADLEESLGYQTATSEVLQVIGRSTFDLEPVLQNLVETAVRICAAEGGAVNLLHADGLYRMAASTGDSREYREPMARTAIAPGRGSLVGRTALEGRIVHIQDVHADPEFTFSEGPRVGGFRTILGVPLLREDKPIGVFAVVRYRVEPFTERQIELVRTFAAQAVIAIENTRLLTELRESLETAAGDVRSAGGHQFIARGPRAGVRCNARQGHAAVRGGFRGAPNLRRRALALRRHPRCARRLC